MVRLGRHSAAAYKSEHTISFRCDGMDAATKNRIAMHLTAEWLVFLEVDEHQHRFGYDRLVSCDLKRMGQVMESLAIEAGDLDALPNILWLRYNPHAWRVDVCFRKSLKPSALLVCYSTTKRPVGIGTVLRLRHRRRKCSST